jgi:hypothetical protein
LKNNGYEVSLEKLKIYIALKDNSAEKHRLLRVIDESGEDYLYPRTFFAAVKLTPAVGQAVLTAK